MGQRGVRRESSSPGVPTNVSHLNATSSGGRLVEPAGPAGLEPELEGLRLTLRPQPGWGAARFDRGLKRTQIRAANAASNSRESGA